jgi:hypothetical protein
MHSEKLRACKSAALEARKATLEKGQPLSREETNRLERAIERETKKTDDWVGRELQRLIDAGMA